MTFFCYVALFLTGINTQAQNFYAQSGGTSMNVIDSCTTVTLTVNTFLGCINWQVSGSAVSVNNGAVDMQVHCTSSFICAGAISNPVFIDSIGNLSPGVYPVTATSYLDNVLSNSIRIGTLTVSACTTTGLSSNNPIAEFDLYPNPVYEDLYLTNVPEYSSFQVLDITGSVVIEGMSTSLNSSTAIDCSNLAQGVYFFKLIHPNRASNIRKFVVK